MGYDLVLGNIRVLNCFNTYYMYYIVKKKTCTNCLKSFTSRVSLLTAYWEATNLVSSHLWVQEAFIPHHACVQQVHNWKLTRSIFSLDTPYTVFKYYTLFRVIKSIVFVLQQRSNSYLSFAKRTVTGKLQHCEEHCNRDNFV